MFSGLGSKPTGFQLPSSCCIPARCFLYHVTVSCKGPVYKSENVLAIGIAREMRPWNLELTGTYLSNCWCEGIFILPFGTRQFSITPVIVTHVTRTIYACCVTQGTVGHATPSGFGCNEGHDHGLKSRYEESKVTHGAYKADLISAHAADLLQYLINVQCHYDKETWSGGEKRRLGTRVINWGYVHTRVKTGNKSVQLVLQQLLQNKLNSDVALLTTHELNLSCNKLGFCKLREYWLLIGKNYAGVTPYMGVTSLAAK